MVMSFNEVAYRRSASIYDCYLDDNNSFLNDIVDLGIDEIQENIDTPLRSFVNHNSTASNSTNGLTHEINIDLRSVSIIKVLKAIPMLT